MTAADEALDAFTLTLNTLSRHNAVRKEVVGQIQAAEANLVDATAEELDWARAADVVRSFSDGQSEKLKADMERLVTHALRSVFEDELEFKVTTRIVRNTSVVEFALVSNGVARPVLGSHGGGVAQVVGFVLRVLVVMLTPTLRPFIVLDEPFSQVSTEYRPRLAQFIRELVDATPLQLVVVTHDADLPEVADVHYTFSAASGVSSIALHQGEGQSVADRL